MNSPSRSESPNLNHSEPDGSPAFDSTDLDWVFDPPTPRVESRPKWRDSYPPDWEAISRRIRVERAGDKCEWCHAQNHEPHPITGSKVWLTVAHLNHTPSDCRDENLVCLCPRCHNRHDKFERGRQAAKTRRSNKVHADDSLEAALNQDSLEALLNG